MERAREGEKYGLPLTASEADRIFASLEVFDDANTSGTSRDSPLCNGVAKTEPDEASSSPAVDDDGTFVDFFLISYYFP